MAMDGKSGGRGVEGEREVPTPEDLAALLPDYEIVAMIGRGGMGAVYRAVQRNLERPVAIKVLPVELGDAPGFSERFRQEAMTTAGLDHPDIVAVYDVGETVAGHWYYVMELVDGEDLAQRMARGLMSVEQSLPLLEVVCGAVEAAHARGIIHRDIKPSNILLTREGRPRLADFGLALLSEKHLAESRLTMGGTTLGTLEYAAPEQLAGYGVTTASDLYSLGVLAYELLTGELPRGIFDPPSMRNRAVDPAFDAVILTALQSDPLRRHASVAAFRQALLHAADRGLQQEKRERELRGRLARKARTVLVLAAIAVLSGGSAIYAWRARLEAGQRRAEAVKAEAKTDGLIQFLLTDLRKRLEPTGNLGAMESVLERAVVHYREKYEAAGHSPDAAGQLADVLVVKGDVVGVRGLREEADQLYTEAIALTEAAWRTAPGDAKRSLRRVRALEDRSEHRMASGRYEAALEDARLMLAAVEMVPNVPPDATIIREVAAAHKAIANALGYVKQLDESRAEYLAACGILAKFQESHPGDAQIAGDLADLDTSLGSLAEAQEDYPEMLKRFTSWNEHVKKAYGANSDMYSYSAFRMGVALVKTGSPAGAVPYLTDAVRLAEGPVAAQPGHQGALSHLTWCLHYLVQALEESGQPEKAAGVRTREAAVKKLAAAVPQEAEEPLEKEFAGLCAKPETPHKEWWAFCQQVQVRGEKQETPQARTAFYQKWLERGAAAAATGPEGNLANSVEAFIRNRLASHALKEDPALSASHARQALALRRGMVAAHPGDPALERNVVSSAGHLVEALLRSPSAPEALGAIHEYAAASGQLSLAALLEQDQALLFARNSSLILDEAVRRWPEEKPALARAGADIAAALLDRLPAEKSRQAAGLRSRLIAPGQ